MPILKGSATFSRYRVEQKRGARKDASEALRMHAFTPLDPTQPEERAQGFVELEDRDGVEFTPGVLWRGERAVFAYRVDAVKIPSAVVKQELESWVKRFEEENGRKPGKREKADAKAELMHTLRARYPLATKTFDVSWEKDVLMVWAGSRKMIDEVQAALEKAFGFELHMVAPVATAARLELNIESLKPTEALHAQAK